MRILFKPMKNLVTWQVFEWSFKAKKSLTFKLNFNHSRTVDHLQLHCSQNRSKKWMKKIKKKESEILTGHVNSNGNLIGVIDGPFCGCDCVAVRLNVLSPRICVAAAPNVQDVVKSTAAWYSLRQIRNRVLQLPWHDSFGSSFSLQHRPALFKPLSLRKDFNLNSNNPEHVICGKEMKKKKGIRNGMRLFEFRLFRAIQFPSQNNLLHTKKKAWTERKNLEIELNTINYEN